MNKKKRKKKSREQSAEVKRVKYLLGNLKAMRRILNYCENEKKNPVSIGYLKAIHTELFCELYNKLQEMGIEAPFKNG